MKVPEWLKKFLLIDSDELKKERSHSTLLNLNKTRSNMFSINVKENGKDTQLNITQSNEPRKTMDHGDSDHSKPKRKSSNCDCKHLDEPMYKIVRLIKSSLKKSETEMVKLRKVEELKVEWKEAASRLENIFLVVSLVTIIVTPIVLFGKYFRKDYINFQTSTCGCES